MDSEKTSQRDAGGLFAKGNTLSPGRPKSIFQDLGPRRAHFLETLSRDEILALVDDDTRLGKYSGFDAQILLSLADTLRKTPEDKLDPGKERERLYDRMVGKPKETIEHQGGVQITVVTGVPEPDATS